MSIDKSSHWAVKIATQAMDLYGTKQVVCSGWSPSGVYHYGNSKEIITCNAFHRELLNLGAKSEITFVVDDSDPLNKIPFELKKYGKELRPYIGHPMNRVPDLTGGNESYAMYFASGAIEAFEKFNFDVNVIKASDLYKDGMYDDALKEYREKEERVQQVIEGVSGSRLASLINVICENCGSVAAPVIETLENERITYNCISRKQFRGCDHHGHVRISEHQWKLRWRLDWPARQRFLGVTIEPSGKDHSVQGGSVDSALAIHEKIFQRRPPILERFGFITIKGQKISGSKGNALQARQISDIMPFPAYLFLNYRADLLKDISFNPSSTDFPNLIDDYDKGRRSLIDENMSGSFAELRKLRMAVALSMEDDERGVIPSNFRYSELILLYQISLRNADATIEKLADKIVDKRDIPLIRKRLKSIDHWLDTFAPAEMKYEFLLENAPNIKESWASAIKEVWITALNSVDDEFDEELFTENLRAEGSQAGLGPKDIYPPFYQMLLNQNRGPNAAKLVKLFGREYILERITSIEL